MTSIIDKAFNLALNYKAFVFALVHCTSPDVTRNVWQ